MIKSKKTAAKIITLKTAFSQKQLPLTSKLCIAMSEGVYVIKSEEILRIESQSNYAKIYLKSGVNHLVSKTLKNIQDQLSNEFFIRVHNSHVVNIEEIIFINFTFLRLTNGDEIPISRSKKNELRKLFKNR